MMGQSGRVGVSQLQSSSQTDQLATIHTQDACVKISETRNDTEAVHWITKTEKRKTALECVAL